jgi:uncharacterized membrane protein YtjA (UPF0391 family)
MLHWSLALFLAALVAALFAFPPIAAGPPGLAEGIFFVLLASSVTSFVAGMVRVRRRLLRMDRVRTDRGIRRGVTGGLSR